MFDASDTQHSDSLPHAAARCLIACSAVDHALAETLRAHSSGDNNRSRKRRAVRLKRRAADHEANAVAMAGESR